MKKSIVLSFIVFVVFLCSYPAQAGYWKLSGKGEIGRKPEDHKSMRTNSFDTNHVDVSYKTFDWDEQWSRVIYTWDAPPQIIRQGEVIPVSVRYRVSGFFREPRGCSIAFDIFKFGASDARVQLIEAGIREDNPREGEIINTRNKAPASTGDRYMQYGCFLLEVSFPYKWVEDEVPPASQPSTSGKTPGVTIPSSSSDFSGTWCVVDDPQRCVVIKQEGESVKAELFRGGAKTADLLGYQEGASITLSFRNSKGKICSWVARLNAKGRLVATCLNPDGSLRWKAKYIRK